MGWNVLFKREKCEKERALCEVGASFEVWFVKQFIASTKEARVLAY